MGLFHGSIPGRPLRWRGAVTAQNCNEEDVQSMTAREFLCIAGGSGADAWANQAPACICKVVGLFQGENFSVTPGGGAMILS